MFFCMLYFAVFLQSCTMNKTKKIVSRYLFFEFQNKQTSFPHNVLKINVSESVLMTSGIPGEAWQHHRPSVVPGQDWNGPDKSRPSYVYPGEAVSTGNVRRLLRSPGPVC